MKKEVRSEHHVETGQELRGELGRLTTVHCNNVFYTRVKLEDTKVNKFEGYLGRKNKRIC